MKKKAKYTACLLCGKDKKEPLLTKYGNRIVNCKNCGLIFVDPQPSSSEIKKFYGKHYFKLEEFTTLPRHTSGYRNYLSSKGIFDKYYSDKLNTIEEITGKKGKVLDIGCSLGFFLEQARGRGWDTYGVDISEYAYRKAKKLGLKVFLGNIEDAGFKANYLDVIVIFQTVEHFINPIKTLKLIYEILRPNGLIYITTPNIESLYTKLLGKSSFQFKSQEHLYYFSRSSIQILLEKTGFRQIQIRKDSTWHYSLDDLLERMIHYYPKTALVIQSIRKIINKTLIGGIKVPIPFGTMQITARK